MESGKDRMLRQKIIETLFETLQRGEQDQDKTIAKLMILSGCSSGYLRNIILVLEKGEEIFINARKNTIRLPIIKSKGEMNEQTTT